MPNLRSKINKYLSLKKENEAAANQLSRIPNSRINPKSQHEPLIVRQQILKPRCSQGCSESSMPK